MTTKIQTVFTAARHLVSNAGYEVTMTMENMAEGGARLHIIGDSNEAIEVYAAAECLQETYGPAMTLNAAGFDNGQPQGNIELSQQEVEEVYVTINASR